MKQATPTQLGEFLTPLEEFDAVYAESDAISRSVWANYTVLAVDDQDETRDCGTNRELYRSRELAVLRIDALDDNR